MYRYISLLTLFSSLVVAFCQTEQTVLKSHPQWLRNGGDDEPHPKPPGSRVPVPALYQKRYSEQTFIGAHDAVAIRTADNNWSLSGNQYFDVAEQLKAGVRLIQAQGHIDPNGTSEIRLCHFNCALMDGGSLHDLLYTVRAFLLAHPQEIVTLLFVNTGPPLRHWAKAFFDTGLDTMSYVPPLTKRYGNMRIQDWPTMAQMIETNTRLVTFLDKSADESLVPFLLWEFDYLFETKFAIDSPGEYECEPSRPWWIYGYVPDRLSLVNHFLYASFLGFRYPNASYAGVTNAMGFSTGMLGEHAVRCREMYERRPNFLLVDFFNEGDVFDVEYGLNAN